MKPKPHQGFKLTLPAPKPKRIHTSWWLCPSEQFYETAHEQATQMEESTTGVKTPDREVRHD